MKKENRKKIGFIVIIVLVILGTFIISELTSKENEVRENPLAEFYKDIPESEQKEAITITDSEYYDLKSSSDMNIIYIARPTCGYCTLESPVFYNVLYKYNLTAYYLNTDSLTQSEYQTFIDSDSNLTNLGTPTIIVTKDNIIIKMLEGLTGSADIISTFKALGIIGE